MQVHLDPAPQVYVKPLRMREGAFRMGRKVRVAEKVRTLADCRRLQLLANEND